MARWEIQQRQRRDEIGNLGADNRNQRPSLKYKRAFFIDWRAADRLKKQLLGKFDFYLDTNNRAVPKMISGRNVSRRAANHRAPPVSRGSVFRSRPLGRPMDEGSVRSSAPHAQLRVVLRLRPEENSLLFGFGDVRIESPAINLVFRHPRELLGDAVHGRFGAEFPIRFDFLDTWEGGNLSLQVHPLTEYIQAKFGMHYTQDESYYLLDAKKDGAVYLGLKNHVDRDKMARDLFAAQRKAAHPSPPHATSINSRRKSTTTS